MISAHSDPQIHAIPTKQPDQQALQAMHRVRQALMSTRHRRINLARGTFAEFGISLPKGASTISRKFVDRLDELPATIVSVLNEVIVEINDLKQRFDQIDTILEEIAKTHPVASLLMTIPGIGVVIATAVIASVPDIHIFTRARQFSGWLGITPSEHSSGNKRRLGAISKRGDRYLRTLLIHGARSALLAAQRRAASSPEKLTELQQWVLAVRNRRPHNVATVALANKMARIIWATCTQGEAYATH